MPCSESRFCRVAAVRTTLLDMGDHPFQDREKGRFAPAAPLRNAHAIAAAAGPPRKSARLMKWPRSTGPTSGRICPAIAAGSANVFGQPAGISVRIRLRFGELARTRSRSIRLSCRRRNRSAGTPAGSKRRDRRAGGAAGAGEAGERRAENICRCPRESGDPGPATCGCSWAPACAGAAMSERPWCVLPPTPQACAIAPPQQGVATMRHGRSDMLSPRAELARVKVNNW